jgi:hypothetical protein
MKSLLLLAFSLCALPLHAALKWESTTKFVQWKPGQSEAVAEFAYRNASKTPQKIIQLKGSCACCTGASASKKNLQPGDSGIVRMRVDLRGKNVPIAKAITVTTDDGEIVSLVLRVATPGEQTVSIPRWGYKR